jgi:hypothetical protein
LDDIKDVVRKLEAHKAAIERALAAFGEMTTPAKRAVRPAKRAAKKKRGLSEAGRKALSESMKQRWVAKRTAAQAKKRKKAA